VGGGGVSSPDAAGADGVDVRADEGGAVLNAGLEAEVGAVA
jgi:hypothetical protein